MKYILAAMLLTTTAFAWAVDDNATGTNCSGDQVASDRTAGKDTPTVTTTTGQGSSTANGQ